MASVRCWCGNGLIVPFGEHYLSCEDCDTLIVAEPPAGDITRIRDDERDAYGRRYFFEHQEELGHPNVETRAQSDLAGRCIYWLRTALRYLQPPARVLELGSSHGGFVALLRAAGFDATGLELSPWIVDYARRSFDVPMLHGPLEDQDLEAHSFDLIVAMDVLEHLPDPTGTLERALELLAPGGMLLMQTPCRPASSRHRELVSSGHRFLEMLLPDEHLHLFSQDGIRRLLSRLGAPHIAFEPALFAHYDMFFAASREPLHPCGTGELREHLCTSPTGRQLLAMLDLHQQLDERTQAFLVADADRVGRQSQIEELLRVLEEKEEQRLELESLIRREREQWRHEGEELRRTIRELQRQNAEPL